MNSTERAFDGWKPLLYLVVLAAVVSVGPTVAGATPGGHLQAESGSATATLNDDVAEREPLSGTTADAPFVPAYGAAETRAPTSPVEVRVARGDGPVLEAGANVDAADRRAPGSLREVTMEGTDPGASIVPAGGDATDAGPPSDSGTDDAGDRNPLSVIGTLLGGMTLPVDPSLPAQVVEFGLGFLFGGSVVAVVTLRNHDTVPALDEVWRIGRSDRGDTTDATTADPATGTTTADPATGTTTTDLTTEATTAEPAGPSADAGVAEPELTESDLVPDDRLVERLLARNQGRLKQSAIVEATEWSKSKVSRLLASMAEEDRIVKVSVGRENVIYLEGEEPGIVSEQSYP